MQIDENSIEKHYLVLMVQFNVNSSRHVFFEWFKDFNNYALIFSHVNKFVPLDDLPLNVSGKKYLEYADNFLGKEKIYKAIVLHFVEDKFIIVQVFNPLVKGIYRFAFYEDERGKTIFEICLFTTSRNLFRVLFLKVGLTVLFAYRYRFARKNLTKIFPF